ncbi:MAG: hypothetical protein JJE28_06795 [Actinomycetales bacterium]|nr:hypothetical protein [Actinomycetales bacterium]
MEGGRGVVGFDIAGAELGFPASNHVEAFNYLAHEYFPVTIHAGEADGLGSIESALFDGRALRLGTGCAWLKTSTSKAKMGMPRM